MSRTTCISWV